MLLKLQSSGKEALGESDRLLDSRLDNAIEQKTNETLTITWLAKHSCRLYPSQEGTYKILGSMWRSLMNRRITTENVKALRTLHSTEGIELKTQILKLGELQMLRNEDMSPANCFGELSPYPLQSSFIQSR